MADFTHFTLVLNKKGKELRYEDVSSVHIERVANNIFVKFDDKIDGHTGIRTVLLDRIDTIRIEYETINRRL